LEFDQAHFGQYKLWGFLFCFFLVAAIQAALPYRQHNINILRNWSRNIPLALINGGAMSLVCVGCLCTFSLYQQKQGIGLFNSVQISPWISIPISIIALDFIAYFWHRMNHKFSWLWRFHSVHHTDQVFDASTAVRFHIGELLISLGIRFIVVTIFGMSIASIFLFELIFQFFNIFEHGNIRLPLTLERWLAFAFVTPALHRKHHSMDTTELNSNFGTVFSFWDKLGRSFKKADSSEKILIGLSGDQTDHSVFSLFLLPFRKT
jgi:sterol desaturase/sphingolipid hydroxylase (fatty acid hydroxylase superfamily)